MPQYQPTTYYDWKNREHGAFLESGVLTDTVSYDYYAGDTITTTNSAFRHMNYVSYDNTHVRLLNDTDLNLYDTSDMRVYDSGTITQYTSAAPVSRVFTVDSTGKVGIGLHHTQPLSSIPERPAFDLHVRGTVGVEDFIYHNNDTDTYILFGSEQVTHYVNSDGSPDVDQTTDYNEINLHVGGKDMIQMTAYSSVDIWTTGSISRTGMEPHPAEDSIEIVFTSIYHQDQIKYIATYDASSSPTDEQFTEYVQIDENDPDPWTTFFTDIATSWNSSSPGGHHTDGLPVLLQVGSPQNRRLEWVWQFDRDTDQPGVIVDLITPEGNVLYDIFENNTQQSEPDVKTYQPEIVLNKSMEDVDVVVRTSTNSNALTIDGSSSDVVINNTYQGDTDFIIRGEERSNGIQSGRKFFTAKPSENNVTIYGFDSGDILTVAQFDINGYNNFNVNGTEVTVGDIYNGTSLRVRAGNSDMDYESLHDTNKDFDGAVPWDKQSALYVDRSTGYVGMGTDAPDTTLHVNGDTQIDGNLTVRGVTNQVDTLVNVTSAIDITNHGTGPALSVKQTGAQPVLTVLDDSITAFHIEDGGNVGINTANPDRLLDVSFSENNSTETDDREIDGIRIINNDTTVGSKTGLNFSTPGTSMAWIGQRYSSDHMCLKLISESYKGDPNSKGSILNISASGEISYKTDVYHCSLYINDDDAIRIPVGTSAQRPDTAANNTKLGLIRYNTELQTFEGFGAGYQWGSLGGVIDVDRDTFWTATNLLSETPYPGDPDALRAYSQDTLMMQIEKDETRITTGTVGINHAPGSSIEETVHVHGGVRAQNRIYTDSGSGVYHKKYVLPSGTTEMDQFTISPVQGVQKAISFQITICNESFACVKMYNVAYVNTGYTAETKFITQKTIDTGPVSSGNDIDLEFEEHIDGINSGVVVRVKRPSGNLEARGCVTIVLAGGYTNMRINNL